MNILNQRTTLFGLSVLTLMFLNLLLQFLFFLPYLDNNQVNQYQPAAMDAYGYTNLAEAWVASGSFVETFKNSFRLPGYPLFLTIFYQLFDLPLQMARYAQMILLTSCIYISYLISKKLVFSDLEKMLVLIVVSSWPAFYYFSPIIYAEALSIFFAFLFFYAVVSVALNATILNAVLAGLLLAVLIYLKPNHIFLFIPAFAYWIYTRSATRNNFSSLKQSLKLSIATGLTVLICILPWTYFISTQHQKFIPLSLTNAINLFEATGDYGKAMPDTLPGKISEKFSFYAECPHWSCIDSSRLFDPKQANLLREKAFTAWLNKPWERICYGLAKIGHSHGFSFRTVADIGFCLLLLSSLASSFWLWKEGKRRSLVIFYWVALLTASLQTFVFLPDQRFKIIIFELPALLMLVLAFAHLKSSIFEFLTPKKHACIIGNG